MLAVFIFGGKALTGIIFAMESEARPFLKLLTAKREFTLAGRKCCSGKLCSLPVRIIVSGIGKVNAASAAQALISKYKDINLILNIGVTGAVNPLLKVCDVCAAEKTLQYDFDITAINDVPLGYIENIKSQYIYTDKNLYGKYKEIFGGSITVATADRFSTKKEEADLILSLGGDVRDMECGAIAQVCLLNNVPFMAIKSISDTASGDASKDFKENLLKSTQKLAGFAEKICEIINNG